MNMHGRNDGAIWTTQSKRIIVITMFWHSANFQIYTHYNELEESLEASICTTKTMNIKHTKYFLSIVGDI
jgi:hypothetical protein